MTQSPLQGEVIQSGRRSIDFELDKGNQAGEEVITLRANALGR